MGDMTEPDLTVRKHSTVVQISRDHAIDLGLVQPTAAERREYDNWHAEYERRKHAATAAWPVFVAALNATTDPVGRAVLDLHKADEHGRCSGCDYGGYEAEPAAWPCSTTTTVAKTLGIHTPDDLHMAEQASQW